MEKINNIEFIDRSIHRLMKVARLSVDNDEMTKEEMAAYIPERANEEFVKIFGMNEEEFAMSLLDDLLDMARENAMEIMKGDRG